MAGGLGIPTQSGLAVAAGKYDGKLPAGIQNGFVYGGPVFFGHDHIEKQQVNFVSVLMEQGQGFVAVQPRISAA